MDQITKAKRLWDKEKKQELINLGNSQKSYDSIVRYLEVEIANSKRMTNFEYKISCFKNDGIYQLSRAIEQFIGVSDVKNEEKPSGGEGNMNTIDIQLADGTRKKVPYGDINLPNMGENAMVSIGYDNQRQVLYVSGSCQFRFQHLMDQIIDRTNELLNTDSIYKNQAFEINGNTNDGQPILMDLKNIDKEIMILSDETEYALSPLKARITKPQECLAKNIPLKFGCLLEGPYGGK